jgi:glycosyltransferase involved in cell wall biosynthesis
MTPLLTIVTITYNAEPYLGRTAESVKLALGPITDPKCVEYLIIDGGSRDATLKIADHYHAIITKTISEPDKGLYDAMNKGLRIATGKYVWFLNAGDEIHDASTLSQLLKTFETDADVYYSDALFVRDNGSAVGLRSKFTPHSLPKNLRWQDFALGMKVCHQAFIVKQTVAPEYDYTNLSADIDWEIRCLKTASAVQYLPFVLCKYLLGGVSVQSHKRSLTDRFTILRKHFGLFPTLFNHLRIFWRGFWFVRKNGKYW